MTFPARFARLFQRGTLAAVDRLAAMSRVENATFFRDGLAGDVVQTNGRATPAALVTDAAGGYVSALCACTPKPRPNDLCVHVARLVQHLHPGDAPASPWERFGGSVWALVAKGAHEARTGDPPALPFPVPNAVTSKEAFLRRLTVTADETAFNRSGVKTNRQAWEESAWFRWAKAWFEREGDVARSAALVRRDGRFFFSLSGADVPAAPAALSELLRRDGGRFASDRGFRVLQDGLSRAFRLSLRDDEALRLSPVFLVKETGGVLPRSAMERFGDHIFVAELSAFVTVEGNPPLFPESDAPPQTSLPFDDRYVPSPLGVPHDRETVVPPEDVVRFLTRHRAALDALPDALVPEALRRGAAPLPDATLTVVGQEGDRFLAELVFHVGGKDLALSTILSARRRKLRLLMHAGRLVDLYDATLGLLSSLPKDALLEGGRLLLAPLDYLRLRSYVVGELTLVAEAAGDTLRQLTERTLTAPAPSSDTLSLYDFQEKGYQWLWFLYRNAFGGLLCDDMGLGKTHQAMALTRAVHAEFPGHRTLIVCPTSLVPHWTEKLRRYLPELPVSFRDASARSGVVVTTYGALRNDAASLVGETFDLFLLDEIQTIKNRGTATYQELSRIQARVAIGLTGTPIENSVHELRNLLDFVLPGYLPGEAEWRRAFGEGAPAATERLQRLVYPFVLRRTKAQVLTSLPPKFEDKRRCTLTEPQAVLYRQVVEGKARALVSQLESAPVVSYLHVFAVLNLLKQVCNHPALLGDEHRDVPSGKWDLFTELLDESLESGLKVVVFSQYVKMLKLMEAHLLERGIAFATIRGDTVDRAGELSRFQGDSDCRVFLGSLRASGLGVDLTAASVVIHYDRWWNQAREDQATDRVHRHGQTRGVQVLKLITSGTLEEKIDAMIERKARLAGDVVAADDPRLAKQFTRDELKELLS